MSFGIWRRSTMSPGNVASGRIPWMWHSAVCGTNGDGEQSSQHFADPDGPRLPGLPGHFEREPEGKEITGLGGKCSAHNRGLSTAAVARYPSTVDQIPYLRRVPSLQRNYSASCGGLVAIAARLMACGPSRRGAPCKPSQTALMRHCQLSVLLAILQSEPDRICNKPCPVGENLAPDGRCAPGAIAGYSIKTAAVSKSPSLITNWTAIETAALEDDIPPPARKTLVVPAPPQRSMVATTNRERPLQHSESNDARVSQRADRGSSRRQSEFTRMVFQRFDSSLR